MSDLDAGLDLRDRTFGLTLCLGVLYHLKNPFGLLETLAHHSRYCLLSTRIAQVTLRGTPIADEPVAYLLIPRRRIRTTRITGSFPKPGSDVFSTEPAGFCATTQLPDSRTAPIHPIMTATRGPSACCAETGGALAGGGTGWRVALDGERKLALDRAGIRSPHQLGRDHGGADAALPVSTTGSNSPGNGADPAACDGGRRAATRVRVRYAGRARVRTEIPAAALTENPISIRFEMDKAWGPTAADCRELGVQVVFWSGDDATPRAMCPIAVL